MYTYLIIFFAFFVANCAACSKKSSVEPNIKKAVVAMELNNADKGSITLEQKDSSKVKAVLDLKSLDNGESGIVVMKSGDCTGAVTLKEHFNFYGKEHGKPGEDNSHTGDLGSITIANNVNKETLEWKLSLNGPKSVIGRRVVIFKNKDTGAKDVDLGDQLACGTIVIKEEE